MPIGATRCWYIGRVFVAEEAMYMLNDYHDAAVMLPEFCVLFDLVLKAIRKYVNAHPDSFPQDRGAVRMTANPTCQSADDLWLRGGSDFSDREKPDVRSTSKDGAIVPGGDVLSVEKDETRKDVIVDHSAEAERMIALCYKATNDGREGVSGLQDEKDFWPKSPNAYGAYMVKIYRDDELWCEICVAVSIIWRAFPGSFEVKRNLRAAYEAASVIKEFFDAKGFTVAYPESAILSCLGGVL